MTTAIERNLPNKGFWGVSESPPRDRSWQNGTLRSNALFSEMVRSSQKYHGLMRTTTSLLVLKFLDDLSAFVRPPFSLNRNNSPYLGVKHQIVDGHERDADLKF